MIPRRPREKKKKKKNPQGKFSALITRLFHFKLTQSALAVFAVALGAKSPAKRGKMEEGVLC